jgi:hypothetical protein
MRSGVNRINELANRYILTDAISLDEFDQTGWPKNALPVKLWVAVLCRHCEIRLFIDSQFVRNTF